MTKKILFRADGNSVIGLGHLYRLFSLVEIIKDTIDFVFITHKTSVKSIIPKEYRKVLIPETVNKEEEPKWLAANFSTKEFIIIADGYQFNSVYQKEIKELGYKLLYIDDLAKEYMHADLVINHSPFIKEKHYSKEAYTDLFLGTKYALLRPNFLKIAKQNRIIKKINTAFVCFGGSDPFDLTLKSVKALLKIKQINTIHVILGGAYKYEDIFCLEKENFNTVKTYSNLSETELLNIMKLSNFAIAPASTILYELCCVKMPILSGYYIDNQELIYKGFLNNKAIYKGGNMKNYTVSNFVDKIETIIKENKLNNQILAQKELFDKKIKSRLFNLIKNLC
jgi:UDP-2,4-diacetamido-2,4,6-trideoxy-beta-L-altropyranose hydrolase